MTAQPSLRILLTLATAASLAACGGGSGGGSPTAPQGPQGSVGCEAKVTLDLQPGQTAPLTPEQAACFRLAPHSGARYALAGFDARAIESARNGPEAGAGVDPVYLVGDGTGTVANAAPSGDRLAGQRTPADYRVDAAAEAGTPFARTTPWQTGERFSVKRADNGQPATARVVRVMGGRYVFAVLEADEEGHTGRFIGDTEKGMDYLLRDGLAVMSRVWGSAQPVTSAANGQLLVIYAAWNPESGAGLATTSANPDGSGIGTYLWLNLNIKPGSSEGANMIDVPSYRLKVLAHELTHAWQLRYAYDSQPAGPRAISFGPVWAMEGTADLVSMDLVRRYLGVGMTDNWNWKTRLQAPNDGVTLALSPLDTRGRLSRGYLDAASFLQDVQQRMVRRGSDVDGALAQVARGAVEGWFGVDAAGVRRSGLAARVRAVLGAGWEPSQAVLLWTLTQAADDQSASPELNNPLYDSAADPDYGSSWQGAVDEVQAGRSFAYQVSRSAGSSFFVRVKDDGHGGSVALSASVAGTQWQIARIR